ARLKGRRPDKPFLLLVADRDMAEAQGLAFSESASALARAFWPAPLALVLPGGSGRLPDVLRGRRGGIAVRWTSHRGMATLVRATVGSRRGNRGLGPRRGFRGRLSRGTRAGARSLGPPGAAADARAGRGCRPAPPHGAAPPRARGRAGRRRSRIRAG